MSTKKITYLQAINQAMSEEMRKDERVFLMGEDIGLYGGCFGVSRGMHDEFGPDRVLETPISETGFTGAAVGAAMFGMRPIVEIMFGDFLTLAADPILNHAAKYRFMTGGQVTVPMVLRTPFGSGTGAAAQHSQSLESLCLNTPGVKVVAPSCAYDAKGLLKAAIRDDNPVLFFENKLLYRTKGEVPEEDYVVELGKADIKKEGSDVTIISYARMVPICLQAATTLESQGIHAEVVDLRSLRPLDTETIITSVKKTSRVLIVHESPTFGGFGGEILSAIVESDAFFYLDSPIKRLAGMECPVPYNPELEKLIVPNEESIITAVQELLQ